LFILLVGLPVGEWTKFIFSKNELIVGFVLTALSVK